METGVSSLPQREKGNGGSVPIEPSPTSDAAAAAGPSPGSPLSMPSVVDVVADGRQLGVEEDEDALQQARMDTYGAYGSVSTLDFLRETTDAVLPDAVSGLFSATSLFITRGVDSVRRAMPDPLRAAASKTGDGISRAADLAGAVLANPSAYLSRAIPDAVLNKELKRLLFVDLINTLRCYFNFNVLVVPYVFSLAGLVPGVLLVVAMNALSLYTSHVFFMAKNQLKAAHVVIMYGDVPRMTWGVWYPMMEVWMGIAFLVAYVTYAASNCRVFLLAAGAKISDPQGLTALCYLLPTIVALPLCFYKRARYQTAMTVVASFLLFVVVVLFFATFPYGNAAVGGSGPVDLWPRDVVDFFVALGLCTYAFGPLRTSVAVERTMPSCRFQWLSAVCCGAALVVHLAFGLCAFLTLRRAATCSVLTQSLYQHGNTTHGATVATSALLFVTTVLLVTQPLFRVGEVCDRRVLGLRAVPTYGQLGPNLLRALFLAAASLVSYVFPQYGLILATAGSFFCGCVCLIIPGALDYVRRRRLAICADRAPRWWEYALVVAQLGFGGVVMVGGTVVSMYAMWLVLQSGNKEVC